MCLACVSLKDWLGRMPCFADWCRHGRLPDLPPATNRLSKSRTGPPWA